MSNLDRPTRRSQALSRVIENQTDEERASSKEQNRLSIAEIRAGESSEQREIKLEHLKLIENTGVLQL